jgi:hypothetical protein
MWSEASTPNWRSPEKSSLCVALKTPCALENRHEKPNRQFGNFLNTSAQCAPKKMARQVESFNLPGPYFLAAVLLRV